MTAVSLDSFREELQRFHAAVVAALEAAGDAAAGAHELGRRRLTNLLVEGGAGVFRSLFASGMTDEVLAFVAPRILGDAAASGIVMPPVPEIEIEEVAHPGGDILLRGLVRRVGPGTAHAPDSSP